MKMKSPINILKKQPNVWITGSQEEILMNEMTDLHLYNALNYFSDLGNKCTVDVRLFRLWQLGKELERRLRPFSK